MRLLGFGFLGSFRLLQVSHHRQRKQRFPQQSAGEEQYFEVFNLARLWVQTRDDLVTEFLRFLFSVRRDGIDVQDVSFTVILIKLVFVPFDLSTC